MLLSDLKPNEKNPRILTPERRAMMKKSLEQLGDVSGFVFNKRSGRLVAGHQKKALMPPESTITITEAYDKPNSNGTVRVGFVRFGDEVFKYREVDVDEATEKAMNIASNTHSGEFDIPALADWLSELNVSGLDMELLGFSPSELKLYLDPISEKTGSVELNPQDFETFKHNCPRCGFEFNDFAEEKESDAAES